MSATNKPDLIESGGSAELSCASSCHDEKLDSSKMYWAEVGDAYQPVYVVRRMHEYGERSNLRLVVTAAGSQYVVTTRDLHEQPRKWIKRNWGRVILLSLVFAGIAAIPISSGDADVLRGVLFAMMYIVSVVVMYAVFYGILMVIKRVFRLSVEIRWWHVLLVVIVLRVVVRLAAGK